MIDNKDLIEREVKILQNIPKSQVLDFVEKNWQKLRSLLESDEDLNDQEIMEALVDWYRE